MARNFPSLIEGYLEYTAGHESTLRIRKWCAISIVAAALERRVWLPRGFYTLFPNLYVFIIGRSGFVKKSTSTAIAVNLLREIKGIRLMSERLTAASLINQMQRSFKKFSVGQKTHQQSAVYAYASELSVFLTEVFGSITELLTTFYDCVPNDATKPWVHETVKGGEVMIHGPCLNFLGASTKSWLRKCIPRSEIEGGFTSRIIFVVEENLPDILVPWPCVDLAGEVLREKLIGDLHQIYAMAGMFHVEQEAHDLFSKWYEHHMRNVLPLNQDPRMVGYMSRKGDTILKLAMVHAAATGNKLVIRREDIIWASTEINELEDDWKLAFEGIGASQTLTHEVLEFVRKRGRVPKADMARHFAPRYPLGEVAKCVHELIDMKEINKVILGKGTGEVECYSFPGADMEWR